MPTLLALIELARPTHWLKNVFVLMPVPFAVASGASLDLVGFALGLLGFSLVNSATYAFNDAWDAERDRMHPDKQRRPVASGRVSVPLALVLSALLLVGGFALGLATSRPNVLAIIGVYVAINVLYTLWAKHVALLDLGLLSAGFVLRVLLGCALLDVYASSWLLLCSSTLALFLVLAKRRADILQGVGSEHRPSLAGYNLAFLDQSMTIMAGMSLIGYALYCMDAEALVPGREFATLPLVVFGVLNYLRIVHVNDEGGSPVDLLLASPSMLICGAFWLLAALWSVGLL